MAREMWRKKPTVFIVEKLGRSEVCKRNTVFLQQLWSTFVHFPAFYIYPVGIFLLFLMQQTSM